jgi:YbgC/YbaW family acyl-CoA thioester hydrolase
MGDPSDMDDRFSVRVAVRSDEIDVNGHLNHAIYHRYGEHARIEHLTAAGCSIARIRERGVGIVLLETHVRFLRELRRGDVVDVDSRLTFGAGKTFEVAHTLRRVSADGGAAGEPDVVAAEITCRMGLLDSTTRRLLPEPRARLVELATVPELLLQG